MTESNVPPVPGWFQGGFHAFLRPFIRRHFHAIAIERQSRCEDSLDKAAPLIVYGNHPSWWDPLVAHFLNQTLFADRQFYAPIDHEALQQYRVLGKLGFYGVRLNTTSGAAAFLKQSMAILGHGGTAIWITPEGQFADARDHSAELMPGLAHLCTRMNDGWALPLALEYLFWDERLPVCLAKMGDPVLIADHSHLTKAELGEILTSRLRKTQAELAQLASARSSAPFDNLLRGNPGAGIFYDSMRRVKSLLTGRGFRSQHGNQFE